MCNQKAKHIPPPTNRTDVQQNDGRTGLWSKEVVEYVGWLDTDENDIPAEYSSTKVISLLVLRCGGRMASRVLEQPAHLLTLPIFAYLSIKCA